jgi:hypothetical protein
VEPLPIDKSQVFVEAFIAKYGADLINIYRDLPPLTEEQAANQDVVELWPGCTMADARGFIAFVQDVFDWSDPLPEELAKTQADMATKALLMALVAADPDNAWMLSVPIPPDRDMHLTRAQLENIGRHLFAIAYVLASFGAVA